MIITLLNRGQRQGTFESASQVVPNDIVSAAVVFDLHNNERTTTKTIKFNIYYSEDNGQTWKHAYGATSQGPWPGTGYPTIEFDPIPFRGMRVKSVIDVLEQINCGILLYVNEAPPE
jgi:hypothetical protein